jgi:pullulanase
VERGLPITGTTPYGAYWDVRLADGARRVGFIVHKGDLKDPGPDMFLRLDAHGREVWLVSGSDRILTAPPLGAARAAPPACTTTGRTATTPAGPCTSGRTRSRRSPGPTA